VTEVAAAAVAAASAAVEEETEVDAEDLADVEELTVVDVVAAEVSAVDVVVTGAVVAVEDGQFEQWLQDAEREHY